MVDRTQVVQRPTPQAQVDDPRAFQINQVKRRFRPKESNGDEAAVLTFAMTPSDPDFPYDIESLECVLTVPKSYPNTGKPSLLVKNKDIPRGFQLSIERGFDSITANYPQMTLLGLMNHLDKQLEVILAGKKTETVTIVANRGKVEGSRPQPEPKTIPPPANQSNTLSQIAATPTSQQRADASKKRQADTRQLEARFGRVAGFSKSADGMMYSVPTDSPRRAAWPATLQTLKLATLVVPYSYPLEPATLRLGVDSPEARAVEAAFQQRCAELPAATLTQQINYLSQNLQTMAATEPVPQQQPQDQGMPSNALKQEISPAPVAGLSKPVASDNEDRAHVRHIPRPPEWDQAADSDDSSDEEESESDGDLGLSGDEATDEDAPVRDGANTTIAPAERGILLSFPHLGLHGIELLELTSLHITVKCERCKTIMDIERLRNSSEQSKLREESCKKCASGLSIRFRADMIHANSVRGGYLDMDGCTVVDMLPSNFIPTCSECSTTYPAPGVVAVRGDSSIAICRECHHRMSFRIQEVKFLQVSASAVRASRATAGPKKQRENLGIVAGTELPRQGRCTHYRKSYRWFRFSCCNKVFACDRCHDEQSDHPNEHANRIICGFCSREQNYRPEDCAHCHAALTGKAGRGFWEGGKGTRDPKRMSRKDPRKYKRRPGTKPKT